MPVDKRILEAERLVEEGEVDRAWAIVERYLSREKMDCSYALNTAQKIFLARKQVVLAYQFAKRVAEIELHNPYAFANLGMLEEQLYRFDLAEENFRTAEMIAQNNPEKWPAALGVVYLNWSCMLVAAGRWTEAESRARKALALKPDKEKAKANLGMALLALGKWQEGWPLYDAIIGFDNSRRKWQYANEPVWKGQKGGVVVIYGEQGLGDEISFSSMVPDAIERAHRVTIDCTAKLEGLFKRSFPKAAVYGTHNRGMADNDPQNNQKWATDDCRVDYSISIGALGKLFRPTPESCPGTPWLVPDPDRVTMWKSLFAKQGKPVIGIAWSGGLPWTGDRNRRLELEELLPVFKSVDAVWISLEYKDAGKEIAAFRAKHPEIDLRQYPFGTLTSDYDDTAALVASLDHVVSMQTAVIHLAGGLGVPCYCFVNKYGQWRYGELAQTIPWYNSVRLYRNTAGDWQWSVKEAARDLKAKFADPARRIAA